MPVKARAFFSDELERADVSLDMSFLPELYLIAREDVALNRAVNLDAVSLDVAAALSAWHKVNLAGARDVAIKGSADMSDLRTGAAVRALAS